MLEAIDASASLFFLQGFGAELGKTAIRDQGNRATKDVHQKKNVLPRSHRYLVSTKSWQTVFSALTKTAFLSKTN